MYHMLNICTLNAIAFSIYILYLNKASKARFTKICLTYDNLTKKIVNGERLRTHEICIHKSVLISVKKIHVSLETSGISRVHEHCESGSASYERTTPRRHLYCC